MAWLRSNLIIALYNVHLCTPKMGRQRFAIAGAGLLPALDGVKVKPIGKPLRDVFRRIESESSPAAECRDLG